MTDIHHHHQQSTGSAVDQEEPHHGGSRTSSYPRLRRLSSRDVISSRNQSKAGSSSAAASSSTSQAAPFSTAGENASKGGAGNSSGRESSNFGGTKKERPRSLSAGRMRIRNQDIIQEVYDRMGVNYKRGQSSSADAGNKTMDALGLANDESNLASNPSSTSTATTMSSSTATGGVDERSRRSMAPARSRDGAPGGNDPFQERYRSAAALSRGKPSKEGDEEQDEAQQPRPLSRGRLTQRWPPPSLEAVVVASAAGAQEVAAAVSSIQTPVPGSPKANSLSQSTGAAKKKHSATSKGKVDISSYTTSGRALKALNLKEVVGKEWKDEKKEDDGLENTQNEEETDATPVDFLGDDKEAILAVTPPSIKERITAYGGKNKNPKSSKSRQRTKNSQKTGTKPAVRDYPPKINIYDESRPVSHPLEQDKSMPTDLDRREEVSAKDPSLFRDPYNLGPNLIPEAPGSDTAASENNIRSRRAVSVEVASKVSTGSRCSKQSGLASQFLSSIQNSGKGSQPHTMKSGAAGNYTGSGAPIAEIAAANSSEDPNGGDRNDDGSVAMSSMSGDEFVHNTVGATYRASNSGVSAGRETSVKKQNWHERNRVSAYSSNAGANQQQNSLSPKKSPSISPEAIEKMVDDRVNAHMKDLESRMETHLRRFIHQIDERVMARLGALEQKMSNMHSAIESLQSSKNGF